MAGILAKLAKYGIKVVNWARNNWKTVARWVDIGMAIEWIANQIKKILGIK